jgi:hypothetical protein
MKKIFPIIGHVFLGVILLVFFGVVSLMFIDSQQEHYLWISLALSITLSIIIPILRYKRVIKNKERLSLEVNDIESLKKESNQLSQDDPNRNAKEEELKKLKNKFRKDRKNKDGKKGCFAIIAIAIFFVLSIFGVLNWLFSEDDPVENEAPKTTSIYDQRYMKCYGEMTNAHKARGFHQYNRNASINVKDAVCSAYAEGEEFNYEGKR